MRSVPEPANQIDALYRQHGAALLLFAISIAGDRSLAQDALHQVFLKMLESGMLSRAVDAKAYLFASVRNTLLNDEKIRRRNVSLESSPQDEATWFLPRDRDYAEEGMLRRALAALPEDQREVIVLHIWGELTFAQIAEVLEISCNTAASRYRYALARMRETMCAKEGSCANSRG